ncbi:hypothetical protein [Halorubrum trueperi]|uniref:SHOCT domain-containing protein n=1 Tax=Halorubrum trueperi TaxID=2004704 RepID=A0ABD5UNM7_9EURY
MTDETADEVGKTGRLSARAVDAHSASGLVGVAGGVGGVNRMGGMAGGMEGMGGLSGMGGMGMVMFPLLIFTVAVVLVLAYVAVRRLSADDAEHGATETSATTAEDPIERLKRRYTEGNLSEAEFERALDRKLAAETMQSDSDGVAAGDGDERTPIQQSERATER